MQYSVCQLILSRVVLPALLLFSSVSMASTPQPPCLDGFPCSGTAAYDLTAGGTRTLPFAATWPAGPNTTVNVTVNTMAELNSALAAGPGRNITIPASFGRQSGRVSIQHNDTRINMSNDARIDGAGGSLWNITPGISRIAIHGGTFTDNDGPSSGGYWRAVSDVLFNDVVVLGALTFHTEGRLPGRGNDRIALVNTTVDTTHITQPSAGEVFPFFTYQTERHHDYIFANVRFEQGSASASHAVIRLQNVQNAIVVDSSFNMTTPENGTTGWRSTYSCDDVFISDTLIAGRINNQATPVNVYNVHDITYRNITRYTVNGSNPPAWSNDSGVNNTGTVINGIIYAPAGLAYGVGDPVSNWIGGAISDGGGNSTRITEWSSLPDVSGYGASHVETY